MQWSRIIGGAASIFVVLTVFSGAVPAASQTPSPENPKVEPSIEIQAQHGVRQMMNGRLNAAIATFRQIEREHPASPLGYLLEADATWWKIYYSTANLIDPDVFDVVYSDQTPYDARFDRLVKTAIRKAEDRIHANQGVAKSYLYEGMAYALEGRLAGLRAQDLATARAGKKMRARLITAIKLDPNLTDADAGLGLYNYFVATLPTIVKMLRFLVGLPGGSRKTGLQEMEKAAEHGNLVRAEAKFYLAKDFTRKDELQFAKSLQLFQQLALEFPENPFWKLMMGSVEMRLGERGRGEATYRKVLAETAGGNTLVAKAVHRQVAGALERLHPEETFK
ncbi:MAG: hypothetical protein ACRD3O_11885 [Terriglobia bacterium]